MAEKTTEPLYTAPKLRTYTRDKVNDLAGKYGYRRVSDVTDLLMELEAIITADRRLMTPEEILNFTRQLVKEHNEKSE